jgi:hypothetical protein
MIKHLVSQLLRLREAGASEAALKFGPLSLAVSFTFEAPEECEGGVGGGIGFDLGDVDLDDD